MTLVSITRDKPLPQFNRGGVVFGQLFQLVKRDGSLGSNMYAHIGRSKAGTEAFSVRLDNEEIAQTSKLDKTVAIVGSYTLQITPRDPDDYVTKSRDELEIGEAFYLPNAASMKVGKPIVYGHIGIDDSDRYVSINFSAGDYATTEKGTSEVVVVADFILDAKKV